MAFSNGAKSLQNQDSIIFNADCINTMSYPGSGTVWNSNINPINSGSMEGSVSFDGKHMTFADAGGVDGVVFNQEGNSVIPATGSYETWIYPTNFSSNHDACITTKNVVQSVDTGTDGIYFRFSFLGATDQRVYLYSLNGSSSGGQGFMFKNGNWISANEWSHIVLTIGGTATSDVILYKNGIVESWSSTGVYYGTGGYAAPTSDPLRFGGQPDNNHGFDGKMDCLRIYNKVLTQAEILENYNATKNRFK